MYRNRATLGQLCERIASAARSAWPNEQFELILVDDASPDGAWDEIKALAASHSFVRGVRLSSNSGQHMAVLHGFSLARGEWIVALDGDLQDPPEAVPEMRAALDRHLELDVVFGGRRGLYQSAGATVTSAVYRQIILRAVGLPRDAGMFFVMRRSALQHLLLTVPNNPSIMGLIAARLQSKSVPVPRAYRTVGVSSYNFRRRAEAAWKLIKTYREARDGVARPIERLGSAVADDVAEIF